MAVPSPDDEAAWEMIAAALLDCPLIPLDALMGYGDFHARTMELLKRPRTEDPCAESRWVERVQSPSSVEQLVGVFGEEHRALVEQAVAFIEANEPVWGYKADRVGYVRDCLAFRDKLARG